MFSPPQEFYKDKGRLPTMEEIQNPYQVKPGVKVDEDEVNYVLNWYWLYWLPAAAGASFFNKDHRFYKLPVMPLEGDDSKKAAVTKESEAFGILVCLNCYKKWEHIVPAKHEDPEFTPPDYDKKDVTTHKWYATTWTKATNGQKEGEGWAPAAYEKLSELIKEVKQWRSADKKNDWTVLKSCLHYVQSQNGIEAGATVPIKKKRKKTGSPKAVYQDVEELSDSDWEDP